MIYNKFIINHLLGTVGNTTTYCRYYYYLECLVLVFENLIETDVGVRFLCELLHRLRH